MDKSLAQKKYKLVLEMDRLDNSTLYDYNFSCPQIEEFFHRALTSEAIKKEENIIIFNIFFNRMIDAVNYEKTLYSRLKWLIFLHNIIDKFPERKLIFSFIHEAIQISLNCLESIQKQFHPYDKYLTQILLKPYMQFLVKLCQLEMKEDQVQTEEGHGQLTEQQNYQWYKEYNFLIWTVQTFEKSIAEVKNYFSRFFPYLNMLGVRIHTHLNNRMKKLKLKYKRGKQLKKSISVFDISQLQLKVKQFKSQKVIEQVKESVQVLIEQISEFLDSPLKPTQKKFIQKSAETVQSPFTFSYHHDQ